jgi:hypothetical protein
VFLDHGAELNTRDEEYCSTPLGWAARCGKTPMVEFLLLRGARPNLPDDSPHLAWATPLQWALRRGHDEIVRLLTEFEKTGSLPARGLEQYQTLAHSLVEAFGSGDDAAMQHVMDHFHLRRPLTWDQSSKNVRMARLRRAVWERLGIATDSGTESAALPLGDAQLLVARSLGFKDWDQLVRDVGR